MERLKPNMQCIAFFIATLFVLGCTNPQSNNPPALPPCGVGTILIEDSCECIPNSHPIQDLNICNCDSSYRWNLDSTECVLDTTSNLFTWSTDTIGSYYTILNDVKIIDHNNIWVVGYIPVFVLDSTTGTHDRIVYNLAKWDGEGWNYSNVYHEGLELHDICYFNENDIWVSSGSVFHWDGTSWTLYHLWDMGLLDSSEGGVYHAWGTSSSNMYFVGNKGTIVHYDGNAFTKLESGTDKNFYAVSGSTDGSHVFTCGGTPHIEPIIVEITGQQVHTIYEGASFYSEPAGSPHTVSVYGDTAYFASYLGIWKYNYINEDSKQVRQINNHGANGPSQIYVNSPNDIFMVGWNSTFVHFNGNRWISDESTRGQYGYSGITIYSMDVKDDQEVMVGSCYSANRGLIIRGLRH